MKKHAWLILSLITVVAAFALSLTNMVTEGPIAQQKLLASNAARIAVFPDADAFAEQALAEGAQLDSVYAAQKSGATVGYVLQTTVNGYGGPIEIVLGVDSAGVITGISVGGSAFAETAGLGTRTREPEFTAQFIGLAETPVLRGNIDGISGATISSSAVTAGAARCYAYWQALAGVAAPVAELAPLAAADVRTVTVRGYASQFDVSVGVLPDGSIEGVRVGGDGFAETEGLGSLVKEAAFLDQFAGKTAPVAFGEGIDAVAGATVSSTAVLKGVNEALGVVAEATATPAPAAATGGAATTYIETVRGFQSDIVVTVGLTADGAIASLTIGGPDFNETEYLGAEVQTNAFRDQFLGKSGQLAYGEGIDAVAGATITSDAVLRAINNALASVSGAQQPKQSGPQVETLAAPDADGAVKIVTESVFGFKSEIQVRVGLNEKGEIVSLSIGGPSFAETEYYGAQVQTNAFRAQFLGKSGQLAYGEGVDAVAGATITSDAVLQAINDALTR